MTNGGARPLPGAGHRAPSAGEVARLRRVEERAETWRAACRAGRGIADAEEALRAALKEGKSDG